MKQTLLKATIMVLPALLFAACESGGPAGPRFQTRGVVYGTVLNADGVALAGAEIMVDGEATGVETNGSGYFEISVDAGEHLVTAVADGFSSRPYAVAGGEQNEVVIEMVPLPEGETGPDEETAPTDEEICELHPHECQEPAKEEPPLTEQEICELYPHECQEPAKEEPPPTEQEICELYPHECQEPAKEEPL